MWYHQSIPKSILIVPLQDIASTGSFVKVWIRTQKGSRAVKPPPVHFFLNKSQGYGLNDGLVYILQKALEKQVTENTKNIIILEGFLHGAWEKTPMGREQAADRQTHSGHPFLKEWGEKQKKRLAQCSGGIIHPAEARCSRGGKAKDGDFSSEWILGWDPCSHKFKGRSFVWRALR